MDSREFVNTLRRKLEPLAPVMLPGIIKKQLQEVGATEENLTPELAEKLIERIELALELFVGLEGTKMAHKMMLKELRRCAPEYFENNLLFKNN